MATRPRIIGSIGLGADLRGLATPGIWGISAFKWAGVGRSAILLEGL